VCFAKYWNGANRERLQRRRGRHGRQRQTDRGRVEHAVEARERRRAPALDLAEPRQCERRVQIAQEQRARPSRSLRPRRRPRRDRTRAGRSARDRTAWASPTGAWSAAAHRAPRDRRTCRPEPRPSPARRATAGARGSCRCRKRAHVTTMCSRAAPSTSRNNMRSSDSVRLASGRPMRPASTRERDSARRSSSSRIGSCVPRRGKRPCAIPQRITTSNARPRAAATVPRNKPRSNAPSGFRRTFEERARCERERVGGRSDRESIELVQRLERLAHEFELVAVRSAALHDREEAVALRLERRRVLHGAQRRGQRFDERVEFRDGVAATLELCVIVVAVVVRARPRPLRSDVRRVVACATDAGAIPRRRRRRRFPPSARLPPMRARGTSRLRNATTRTRRDARARSTSRRARAAQLATLDARARPRPP
jgi:hypothetical protein